MAMTNLPWELVARQKLVTSLILTELEGFGALLAVKCLMDARVVGAYGSRTYLMRRSRA
jgi:hypothetical protein